MMKLGAHRMRDGHVVVTAASPAGILATLKMTRLEAMELRDLLDAKLQRSASTDWSEPMADEDTDGSFAEQLRYQVVGVFDGVEVSLGAMDSVRALGRWDEKTAVRLHRELGRHVEQLTSGVIVSLDELVAREKATGRERDFSVPAATASGAKNGGPQGPPKAP
jgi:hypothetical protein